LPDCLRYVRKDVGFAMAPRKINLEDVKRCLLAGGDFRMEESHV